MWQKAGKSSWKQRKVTRIFGTKNWKKTIQVQISISYIVAQKKGAKGRGSFLLYRLGCILLSAYTCEILVVKRISNRFPLHQAL